MEEQVIAPTSELRRGWFRWHGQMLRYADHPYNNTRNNERAVELAVVAHFLRGERRPGLEVGNVLAHYDAPWRRRVVDLTEQALGVENIDVADVTGQYPWIVSVSTIEHVGLPEYGADPKPMAATEAVLHLADCLGWGGRMLVTVPLGYNPDLDADIDMGALGVWHQATLLRHQEPGEPPTWRQAPEPVARRPYNHEAASADAVWIGEWRA
jgi:hypothetical protein